MHITEIEKAEKIQDINVVLDRLGIGTWTNEPIFDVSMNRINSHNQVKDENGNSVWINPNTYDFIPPVESLAYADTVVTALGMHYTSARFLNGKRQLVVEALSNEEIPISPKVGDTIANGFRFRTSFDGSTKHEGTSFSLVLWCKNGCASQRANSGFGIKHTTTARERLAIAVSKLSGIKECFVQFTDTLTDWRKTPIRDNEVESVIQGLFPGETTRAGNVRERVTELFQKGINTEGSTRMDLYNGITQYLTHESTVKETEGKTREENRFFSNAYGPNASLNNKAFELIANL